MGLALAKELSGMITSAVGELPRRHREMLVCWVVDGESFEAIAIRFQVSRSTARREVMEAVARLKAVLERSQMR
jgi:DNA-directed RNA polymerase specialized sigma24 family protein